MEQSKPIESDLIYLLYFAVRVVAAPLLLFYFAWRGVRDPRYLRHVGERLGRLPPSLERTVPGSIWLHAVSVGEVISSIRLIEELHARAPNTPVYVSTTTLTGRAVAEQKLARHVQAVFYAPIDYGFPIRAVLRRIRPAALVILETEIWPVLYGECKRAGCALLIVNGRISDRTARFYARMRLLLGHVLGLADAIFVQTERDRTRYIAAGARPETVRVLGNLKYDAASLERTPATSVAELLARFASARVWIAASTMEAAGPSDVDEEDVVFQAFQEQGARHRNLLLILAPRRPERFAAVEQKLRASSIRFVRRSDLHDDPVFSLPGVLLLDSIGELAALFPRADVVFMGGTLVNRGGHNVLEPAACGKAVITGPHMENFAAIADEFRAADAWVRIDGAEELSSAVARLLEEPGTAAEIGRRAAAIAQTHTGVAARAAEEILRAYDQAIPDWKRPGPTSPLLRVLAQVWRLGILSRRLQPAQALETPVISIGGISMGGSGKTPFTEMLAGSVRQNGKVAAILTRGYRRRSLEESIIVEAGSAAPCSFTGDEAQIFVRSGCAHVGIGADRRRTGKLLEERLSPAVFLLDDGFQHHKLARNLDIVLIDALDPFPGGAVFPLGQLREDMEALARADVFVITRAQANRAYAGIRATLQKYNPRAPVLTARVQPRYWVNEKTGQRIETLPGPVAAFCGLGNPASFWETLRKVGLRPVFTSTFGDHHHYRPPELRRLALQARSRGADVLATTEKDAMNLPDNARDLLYDVDLYWLKIATVLDEPERLMELVAPFQT